MNKNEINKIIIVSLCYDYTKVIARTLSENLGMIYCDVKDLIEYELSDVLERQDVCSKDYLLKRENLALQEVSSYENVVVAIDFEFYIRSHAMFTDNSVVLFVELPKKYIVENGDVVNKIAYQERCEKLKEVVDLSIKVVKTEKDFVCKKIIQTIGSVL